MDEAEQTSASVACGNFTRGRTTLGQVPWGDWGPLVIKELSVLLESASRLDV